MAGEMIASAVVKEVVGKLGSGMWDRLKLSWNFRRDLEEMRITLSALQAVLQDAEKRSIGDEALCLWLKELKAAAYDIDDMLNDFPAAEVKVSDDLPKKVRRFLSSSNPLISRDHMARKMKKMRERLDKIAARRSKFHLKEESASDMQEEIRKRESFSAIDQPMVYGRDEEKEFIVKLLLDENCEENISVIPIVGLGGLGKTTLAKLAFNDERVGIFDLRIWVYASMEFDLKRIGKAIISEAGQKCNLDNLQSISRCVREILAGKRYLLVLDDMWSEKEDDWESLKSILQGGEKGSKIVVTTRSLEIASMMTPVPPYLLPFLREKDCWALFKRRAFGSSSAKVDPSLEQIGKEIAGRCGGVPLVINAIGSMLSNRRGEKTWSAVRDSEIWELGKDEDIFPSEDKILSSLKLSYHHMPSYMRPCFFAYCAVFPRGYEIDRERLILQWIGQGLIQTPNWSLSLEVGHDYFNHLLSMSFFQDKKGYEKTRRVTCKMHDLVYDLARSVAGDEVLNLNPGTRIRGTKWCRYVTLTGYEEPPKVQAALLERVRALHFRSCTMEPCHDMFSWTKCLRVLDLTGWFIDQLPSSVYELKQLRYLDISHLPIQTLRESIGHLQNLQVLNLSFCPLEEIPKGIGSLQKLHVLNLVDCCNLQTLAASICSLENLHTLNLQGCSGLQTLPESIGSLKILHTLNLQDCSSLQTLPESIGNLKNLHSLYLQGCSGLQTLPESIGNLQNLVHLRLLECHELQMSAESMLWLLNIPYLKLSGCHKFGELLKFICFLGKKSILNLSCCESIRNFQNIRHLDLSGCHQLQMLSECIDCLEKLSTLNLSHCPFSILPESIGNLENLLHLNLSGCWQLQMLPESIGNLQNLLHLDLSGCLQLQMFPESIGNLQNLLHLNLSRCCQLQMLPESIGCLQNLLYLNLLGVWQLRMLPEWIDCLEKLSTLNLSECAFSILPESIGNLQNLLDLNLSWCHEL